MNTEANNEEASRTANAPAHDTTAAGGGAAPRSGARATSGETQRIRGWQRLVVWPLGLIARLWMATLRIEMAPEVRNILCRREVPLVFVLWHNRLFVIGEIFRRCRKGSTIYALVSASKDGSWLAAFFNLVGISCVRGSSNFNARESVNLLIGQLRAGNDIGITPDGPRGPVYGFKGGGMLVARRARTPVILMGMHFARAKQLRSWDKFYLPRPFSRLRVDCRLVTPEEIGDHSLTVETMGNWLCELSPDTPLVAPRLATDVRI